MIRKLLLILISLLIVMNLFCMQALANSTNDQSDRLFLLFGIPFDTPCESAASLFLDKTGIKLIESESASKSLYSPKDTPFEWLGFPASASLYLKDDGAGIDYIQLKLSDEIFPVIVPANEKEAPSEFLDQLQILADLLNTMDLSMGSADVSMMRLGNQYSAYSNDMTLYQFPENENGMDIKQVCDALFSHKFSMIDRIYGNVEVSITVLNEAYGMSLGVRITYRSESPLLVDIATAQEMLLTLPVYQPTAS